MRALNTPDVAGLGTQESQSFMTASFARLYATDSRAAGIIIAGCGSITTNLLTMDRTAAGIPCPDAGFSCGMGTINVVSGTVIRLSGTANTGFAPPAALDTDNRAIWINLTQRGAFLRCNAGGWKTIHRPLAAPSRWTFASAFLKVSASPASLKRATRSQLALKFYML